MSQKLTPKLVRKLYPEQNSKDVVKLQLGDKGLTEVLPEVMTTYLYNIWLLH